jgi:Tfp pilus assembly protein PilX
MTSNSAVIKPWKNSERGSVLMLVIIFSIVMGIVGFAAINLAGLQEIAARSDINVARANLLADAGIEYGKMWISSMCVAQNRFPENVYQSSHPFVVVNEKLVGQRGFFSVSIIPSAGNDVDLSVSSAAVIGTYIISSTGTASTDVSGTMDTMKSKFATIRLWRTEMSSPTTNNMTAARREHAAALLPNGKVLIAGGLSALPVVVANVTNAMDLYDPVTRTFTAAGNMQYQRRNLTITAQDVSVGKAVIASGGGSGGPPQPYWAYNSLEFYQYSTNALIPIAKYLPPNEGRQWGHTATLLANSVGGGILIVGGGKTGAAPTVTEVYQNMGEALDAWDIGTVRHAHTATRLSTDDILITGGFGDTGPPGTGKFLSSTYLISADGKTNGYSSTSMATARAYHTATLLPDNRVLIVGGYNGVYLDSATMSNADGTTMTSVVSTTTARAYHTATLLPTGKVLIVGGANSGGSLTSVDLFDPHTDTFRSVAPLKTARAYHTATLLPDGSVLIAGGDSWGQRETVPAGPTLSTAEVYSFPIIGKQVSNAYIEGPVSRRVHP